MTLDEFIAAEAAKPFAWGVTDCCSTANRWVMIRRGISPISLDEWDGSRESALECIHHPYALPARMNRALRKAGIRRTKDPHAGDIGLVMFDGRACVAIHAGSHWFSRHTDGLIGAPLDAVWKAWAI